MTLTVQQAVEATINARPIAPLTYAVGVLRVSEVGDRITRRRRVSDDRQRRAPRTRRERKPEQFKSPGEQRKRMGDWCRQEELELARVFEELDVKGKWPLRRRKGLLAAIEEIEAGHAKVLIVAYFDRLVRNLRVQFEVLDRVEAAGGRVVSVDFGEITEKTAAQWLSAVMVGAMAEYQSRSVGERLASTQAMAIEEGLAIGSIAPGYSEDPITHRLVLHEEEAAVMKEAFRMRADGVSWRHIRAYMARNGIVRTVGSVRKLLHSRTYLGELFHGKHRKLNNHPAITDPITFERVAGRKGKAFAMQPGRKSVLLLSSTRVLRCGTCKKALQAGSQVQHGKTWPVYRCNPNGVCSRRVAIDAKIADEAVAAYVQQKLADESATEGPGMELIRAQAEAEQAQANYSLAQRNLALSAAEVETQKILKEYRDKRDKASAYVAELERRARAIGNAVTLNAAADWDTLSLQGRRDLVTSVLERVEVAPGHRNFRGAGRLSFVDHLGEALG